MTKLIWNGPTQRKYESGVDRGVFYPEVGNGLAWNGLLSVAESFDGGDIKSYYFDGVKTLDITSPKTFQATITALSAPREFSYALGDLPIAPGFILTRQRRSRFGFSYRTLIDGGEGYKLHLVYNALATPTSRSFGTLSVSPSPTNLSWKIDAVPPKSGAYRPSAHYVFDTTKTDPNTLEAIETILYGTSLTEPRQPSIEELVDLITLWEPYLIVPDSDGVMSLILGLGDLTPSKTEGIYRRIPSTSRLAETAVAGLSRLE